MFQKGNKFSSGGTKGNKGGRPSKERVMAEALARELVVEYLARHLRQLVELATKLCMGVKRRKFHPKTGKVYWEKEYDTAMLRYLLERFLPRAKTTVDLNLNYPDAEFLDIQKEVEEAKQFLAAQKDKPIIH